ncbi:MAG TPA: hypothetical protein VJ936_06955 [Desulfobacteraceae bacterium]|nr:hypothetical protein [Desulfobacteraceae bacterium]
MFTISITGALVNLLSFFTPLLSAFKKPFPADNKKLIERSVKQLITWKNFSCQGIISLDGNSHYASGSGFFFQLVAHGCVKNYPGC